MPRSWKSQIADEVRATSMMKPKWPDDAMAHIASLQEDNDRLRQLLSEAEKRERETLTQLSELAETAAGDLVKKWNSDLGATVETKAAGAASHIVNDFRGHIEASLIKLERRAALERSEG